MTIRELEKSFIAELTSLYNFEEARNIAWLAISHECRLNRIKYLGAKEDELSYQDQTSLLGKLEELKSGKPLQYVLGETEFYGLPFKVNPSVLIPRPETEELVDWIIKEVRNEIIDPNKKAFNILDIGTGSGCIPISLKKHLPNARVFGLDISQDAIETARRNSVLNKTEVRFITDDILNPSQAEILSTFYNLIVSNPPYVTIAEQEQMHKNVLSFEPYSALFVSNQNPLQFYKAIAQFAGKHLQDNGKLFLEINENFGKETVRLLADKGFVNIELRTDLRGRPRMIRAGISNRS